MKEYLQSPLVLISSMSGNTLGLYLRVIDFIISGASYSKNKTRLRNIFTTSTKCYNRQKKDSLLSNGWDQLWCIAQKCQPYLQVHKIVVRTDQPLKKAIKSHDKTSHMAKFSTKLGDFHIEYAPRISKQDKRC